MDLHGRVFDKMVEKRFKLENRTRISRRHQRMSIDDLITFDWCDRQLFRIEDLDYLTTEIGLECEEDDETDWFHSEVLEEAIAELKREIVEDKDYDEYDEGVWRDEESWLETRESEKMLVDLLFEKYS